MDSQQAAALRRSRHLKKYLLTGGAVAVAATLAYRAYQLDAVSRSKAYLARLRDAVQKYADALTTGGDICASVLHDLQQFLHSDGNEVPPSLRQVSKLLQSEEFTATATSAVAAIYQGVAGPSSSSEHAPQQSAVDKVLDALLSDRGHSLVSVAVSMGAKNMVAAYLNAASSRQQQASSSDAVSDKLLTFLTSPQGQQLAVMAVAAFASNGMRVYMDKSLEVNLYDDLFSSMARPQHLEAVKQCVGAFARDVVLAYLQGGGSDSGNENATSGSGGNGVPPPPFPSTAAAVAAAVPEGGVGGESPPSSGRDAVSLGGQQSPTLSGVSSSTSGTTRGEVAAVTTTIQALRSPSIARRQHDDLDSDSLLHERRRAAEPGKSPTPHRMDLIEGATQRKQQGRSGEVQATQQWLAVVGKECLAMAKDPNGRSAMAAVAGSATREAVAGVSQAVGERFNAWVLVVVLLLGALSAVVLQRVAGLLLPA